MSGNPPNIDRYVLLASWLAAQNPPGRSALTYRATTYARAYQDMLSDLRTQGNLGSELPALKLNTDETKNWTIGLLQAWAVVLDVLTFYQERIANEGFLRTAIERRSILELVRSIGYELAPGVAASTYLAFTVREAADEPSRRVTIPQWTAVQSVPTKSPQVSNQVHQPPALEQLSQIFETTTAFEARSEWNTLTLANPAGMSWRDIRRNITTLRAAGVKTGLREGDALLVVGDSAAQPDQQPPWMLTFVKAVEPRPGKGYTSVTLEHQEANTNDTPISHPTVHVLHQQAPLRDCDQGGVHFTLSDAANWMLSSLGMPNTPVHALISSETGNLFAGTDKGVFRSSDKGKRWQDASAGLMNSKVYALATSASHSLYAGTDKGKLFISMDDGITWKLVVSKPVPRLLAALFQLGKPPIVPLPKVAIRKLLSYTESGREHLIVATDEGVFTSDDRGMTWHAAVLDDLKPGDKPSVAWTLAAAPNRWKRLAGTDKGVSSVTEQTVNWALVTAVVAAIGALLYGLAYVSGTNQTAVYGLASQMPSKNVVDALRQFLGFVHQVQWYLLVMVVIAAVTAVVLVARKLIRRFLDRLDPLGLPIRSLLAVADNALLAGTESGLFRWNDHAKHWQPVTEGLLKPLFTVEASEAQSLNGAALSNALLDAFKQNSLDLSEAVTVTVTTPGQRWVVTDKKSMTEYTLGLDPQGITVCCPHSIRALEISSQGTLYAGTQDGAVFVSHDNGDHWTAFGHNLHLSEVSELVSEPSGIFAAGLTESDEPDSQWTRYHLENRLVDLDKVYREVAAGSWLVLRGEHGMALYRAAEVSTVAGKGGRKAGSFTSIQVDRAGALGSFDRRNTRVLAQSEPLAPFDVVPLEGDSLTFDGFVPDLEPGHLVLVSGKRLRIRVSGQVAPDIQLVSQDGLQQRPVSAGDVLTVMARPTTPGTGEQRWLVQDKNGFTGLLTLPPNRITLEAAKDDDGAVCEVAAIIPDPFNQPGQMKVGLREPLRFVYDRTTVTVYGNVVAATHGQTVEEVVGSGDGTTNAFILKRKPLTYTQASDASGIENGLTVQVNRVEWHEFPSLSNLSGDQRAYMLRQDADGNTRIIFGNGTRGARIPTGTENIKARYRIGIGEAGNVPAGSLTTLRTRPAGIQKVTNPIPASGGVGPESVEHARQSAPRHVRTMQRVVSLKDYQDFARAFAGIGKAQARAVWDGRARRLHLTIAGAGGAPVQPDSALYADLTDAIHKLNIAPTQPVQIDSFEPVYFFVRARLTLNPDYASDADYIVAQATDSLSNAFAFDARDFGEAVSASEVIALLQRVEGVSAVELTGLYARGHPEAANTLLDAQVARFHAGVILPAQLLLINATGDNGIVLTVQ